MMSKRMGNKVLAWLMAVMVFAAGVPVAAAEDNGEEFPVVGPEMTVRNYASLSNMVIMVCDDAMEQFYNFYGPQPVLVEPFRVLGEFSPRRVTLLGATLADQMAAVINNEAVAQQPPAKTVYDQRLRGVLQEIDGYLRIHMSGQNSRGEWRSYVVTVEMSEPIYRALHNYVVM